MKRHRIFLAILLALLALGALLSAPSLRAMGRRSLVSWVQIKYDGDWNPNPSAARSIVSYLLRVTSVEATTERAVFEVQSPELLYNPFAYMTGCRSFDPWPEADVKRLRDYLSFGGTLLLDDCQGVVGYGFDAGVRRLVSRLYPDRPLAPLPVGHAVYQTFFLLDRIGGRNAVSDIFLGVNLDDRSPILYSRNDLGGAWAKGFEGGWVHKCEPGGERQRSLGFRAGVNAIMYALTVNYKTDQIHIPFILRRRR